MAGAAVEIRGGSTRSCPASCRARSAMPSAIGPGLKLAALPVIMTAMPAWGSTQKSLE
ncbi:hypothetical protein D3C71_1143850 [compost metagenome]